MIRSLLVFVFAAWVVASGAGADPAGATATEPATPPPAEPGPEAPSAAEPAAPPTDGPALSSAPKRFYVLEIEGAINRPTVFIVRRGVKEAIEAGADAVILDMDTPGGGLAETLEIMEILDKFGDTTQGKVITFVRSEAGSAGAIIAAVTDEIYFAPKSVIGAAEVVLSTGEDVGESMKRKITSFLAAKVRALSEEHPLRGQVLQAMMDPSFELKVGETTIKAKDALLTLTATEATKLYGDPPQPLFGSAIVDDLTALKSRLAGSSAFESRSFVMTWSVQFARWLTAISPLLLGIGGMMLAVEFKTPGFGWIGGTGIALILIVMFGHNVAGLAGHEAMLFFLLGVGLVFVEILLLPGTIIFAATGLLLMLGSVLWGMADIWPGDAFSLTPGMFLRPAYTLSLGFLIAVVLFAVALKFLPSTPMWGRLVLSAEVGGTATAAQQQAGAAIAPGDVGVVVSPLRPTGTVEIGGRRFEGRSEIGELAAGTRIRVVKRADFVLIVESLES